MRQLFEKSKALNSIYAQMFIIVIAFAIMGISSFYFATNIEHKHLVNDAENAIAFAESKIITNLLEPETFLIGYTETLRSMLVTGNVEEATILTYMKTITDFLVKDRDRMTGLSNTHGYFFRWGGKYLTGRELPQPVNFNPQNNQWYNSAIKEQGKIVISNPYKDEVTGKNILTFSRYLTDNNNAPLAVICIDIELSRIYDQAITINLTKGSYGILINNNLEILAHPQAYLFGENLQYLDSGIAALSEELRMGMNINERRVKNYMYEDTIVYFSNIKYGWHLGVVIPLQEYYRSVNNMAVFLIVIGSLLASALCTMLYYIAQAKIKSDMRT